MKNPRYLDEELVCYYCGAPIEPGEPYQAQIESESDGSYSETLFAHTRCIEDDRRAA